LLGMGRLSAAQRGVRIDFGEAVIDHCSTAAASTPPSARGR
jgi:hypothetical protein